MGTTTYLLDLREVIRSLTTELPAPAEVWLFGSRAQQTGSKRSDVDLLIIDLRARLTTESLVAWRQADADREPLDLFLSRDGRIADSVVNGSLLKDEASLTDLLGARLLWREGEGLELRGPIPWVQEFRKGVNYAMTIIPTDFTTSLNYLPAELERMGMPNTLLGTDWGSITLRLAKILTAAVDATTRLSTRATSLTRAAASLRDEYDAQNLFYLALRPWLPNVEQNPHVITYAGQSKFADLSAAGSRLIIEVKFVSDASTAAAVTKQLASLADLYGQPSQTRAVLFVIVVKHGVSWDHAKIDHDHTNIASNPVVVTHSVRLPAEEG
jgi:predicted nucleotidyltransferase